MVWFLSETLCLLSQSFHAEQYRKPRAKPFLLGFIDFSQKEANFVVRFSAEFRIFSENFRSNSQIQLFIENFIQINEQIFRRIWFRQKGVDV